MEWKLSWSYLLNHYYTQIGALENVTQRAVLRNNLNGGRIRIRFENPDEENSLVIACATAALRRRKDGRLSPFQAITVNGREQITVGSGERFWSDPLSLPVTPEDDLVISLYYRERTVIRCACATWAAQTWRTSFGEGNQTGQEAFSERPEGTYFPDPAGGEPDCQYLTAFSAVAVETGEPVKTFAFFGDSITYMSFYSDPAALSLYERFPGRVTAVNAGIGGNRLISDAPSVPELPGGGKMFGEAGVKRMERDLYTDSKPDVVFCLEGVNDCMHGFIFGEKAIPTGRMLWEGMEQVIGCAHKRESRIYMGTVMPFGPGQESWFDRAEEIRRSYNGLLLHSSSADEVIDLAPVLCVNPGVPAIRPELHQGDCLHPNAEGGRIMARKILEGLSCELKDLM